MDKNQVTELDLDELDQVTGGTSLSGKDVISTKSLPRPFAPLSSSDQGAASAFDGHDVVSTKGAVLPNMPEDALNSIG